MTIDKVKQIKTECEYLVEYLEQSYCIARFVIDIVENFLYEDNSNLKDEFNYKYFLETVLFTLDDIKNSLKSQINDLNSIEFDTKMNEYYQTPESDKHITEIIPFYRKDYVDDIWVPSDACISDVFKKKSNNFLKLVKDDYDSSENHDE